MESILTTKLLGNFALFKMNHESMTSDCPLRRPLRVNLMREANGNVASLEPPLNVSWFLLLQTFIVVFTSPNTIRTDVLGFLSGK